MHTIRHYCLAGCNPLPRSWLKAHIWTTKCRDAIRSFKLADIGEGIREVVVKEWFVNEGDRISQFQNVCEVQSDKASVTITSPYDGIVKKIHYQVDDVARVGHPLLDVDSLEEAQISASGAPRDNSTSISGVAAATSSQTIERKSAVNRTPAATPISTEEQILALPSIRRMAKELGVDLTRVQPTGKGGRILKEDLLRFVADRPTGKQLPKRMARALDTTKPTVRREPITGYRKVMFRTMTESNLIPQFVYSDEIVADNMLRLKRTLQDYLYETGINVTLMPILIKACSDALKPYDILNATVDSETEHIIYDSRHNIGIAMQTEQGLVVPVIKDVQNMKLVNVVGKYEELASIARSNGVFTPEQLSGGTFTISNIGAIGGTYQKPLILPPQVAIISVGKLVRKCRADENGVVHKHTALYVSGAADHRIIEGAIMADFMNEVKIHLENPFLLFF